MRLLIFLAWLLILSGCSTERFVKRQLNKHPEWAADTTISVTKDTIIIPEYTKDTVFVLNLQDSVDTFTLDNDTVRVEIIRWKEKLIVRNIIKEKPVPYEKQVVITRKVAIPEKEPWLRKLWNTGWYYYILLAVTLIIIAWVKRGMS